MAARGRGPDFELRFQTSRWAEDLVLTAFRNTSWIAVRLGASRYRSDDAVPDRAGQLKEPDLLLFAMSGLTADEIRFLETADFENHTSEDLQEGSAVKNWIGRANLALEIEFSPYRAAEMSGRHWKPMLTRKRLRKDPPVAPNIWVKEEDVPRLEGWQSQFEVPIWILQLFDQEAFAIRLDQVLQVRAALQRPGADLTRIMNESGIFQKQQRYDRTDAQGAAEIKPVFLVTPHGSILAGRVEGVVPVAQIRLSKSKKYITHILFSGGLVHLTADFLRALPR